MLTSIVEDQNFIKRVAIPTILSHIKLRTEAMAKHTAALEQDLRDRPTDASPLKCMNLADTKMRTLYGLFLPFATLPLWCSSGAHRIEIVETVDFIDVSQPHILTR